MQEEQTSTGLIWFTNNLRAHDNEALTEASKNHNNVIAVYFFDPRQFATSSFRFKKTGKYRAKFLIETVEDLKQNLQNLNITLLVFQDQPEKMISSICDTYNVDTIYYQKEWTYEETEIIDQIKRTIPKSVKTQGVYTQFLFHPRDIGMTEENIPEVFTIFRKKIEKSVEIRPEASVKQMPYTNLIEDSSSSIPTLEDLGFSNFDTHPNSAFPFQGGETNGSDRLNRYFFESKKLGVYKKTRNGLVGTDYSSKFSPWLANGSLSAKTVYWKVKEFENEQFKNESTYWLIFELIWRDYFKYISMKHGNKIFKLEGILNKTYDWSSDPTLVSNWIDGNTAEPFVNANMIELKKTGWMSNRGRQNVASFFSKDLKLDWRIGAAYFESMLIDYDVQSNYGNWMYVSGVGNDPRDRKFNVKLQAERYDMNYKYQNLWLQTSLF
jgi:deoxyribodipyrimidine photo-lyase